MADVKWIKITTDMFDNRKIKHLRRLPEGNTLVLLWVMLLTLAGRCNAGGMIFLTENIPYTAKMLADELDLEENIVVFGLQALEQLNMVVMDNGFFAISGWNEYQNIEGMDKIREQNRIRKQRQRAKAALPPATCHVMSRDSHATDIEIEEEKEIDLEIEVKASNDAIRSTDVLRICEAWNTLGLSKISKIVSGSNRDKMLKKRIKDYGIESVLSAIENVRSSNFLKGNNKKGWTITFDWFIKPNNFAKVLEGNYSDAGQAAVQTQPKPSGPSEAEMERMRRMLEAGR